VRETSGLTDVTAARGRERHGPYGPKSASTTDVPWDAVWWWTRPDGMLQLVPSSGFTKQPELIAPYAVATPLWAAHTIVINPKQPRTEEANGTEAAYPSSAS
jgi:hypothetical protein